MHSFRTLTSTLLMAMFATASSAIAQQTQDAHHPDATPSNTSVKAPADSADQMARLDRKMQDMRIMHERMMKAKTPEERSALMAEHAKVMQSGMSMLGGMMGSGDTAGSGATSPQMTAQHIAMMQKQMQMMHSMMQMMMDRMSMQTK